MDPAPCFLCAFLLPIHPSKAMSQPGPPLLPPSGCVPLHASRPEAPGTTLQTHMITGIAAPGNWDWDESMLGVTGWGGKKKLERTDWCSGSPWQHGRAGSCQGKVSLSCGHVFNWWDVWISESLPKSSQLNDSLIVTEHCCLAGSFSLALFWSVLSLSPPVLPSVPGPLKNSSHSSALKACNKAEQREWDIDAPFQNLASRLPRQHVKASRARSRREACSKSLMEKFARPP